MSNLVERLRMAAGFSDMGRKPDPKSLYRRAADRIEELERQLGAQSEDARDEKLFRQMRAIYCEERGITHEEYDVRLAAAVIEAAVKRLDRTADRYARRDADAIRSLDIDSIIASVPVPELTDDQKTELLDWEPIESIPQTLEKRLVACRYTESLHYVEGIHAFEEPASNGQHYFAFWLKTPPRPPVEKADGAAKGNDK